MGFFYSFARRWDRIVRLHCELKYPISRIRFVKVGRVDWSTRPVSLVRSYSKPLRSGLFVHEFGTPFHAHDGSCHELCGDAHSVWMTLLEDLSLVVVNVHLHGIANFTSRATALVVDTVENDADADHGSDYLRDADLHSVPIGAIC
jgi:hypothetical protein